MKILPTKIERCCNNKCPLIDICQRYIQKNTPSNKKLKYGIFEPEKDGKRCNHLIK